MTAYEPPVGALLPSHPNEARDIQRVRAYRVKSGDRTWRIARGDIHRHTDLSWDGNRDGLFDDSYRYARRMQPASTTWAFAIIRAACPSRITGGACRRPSTSIRSATASCRSIPTSGSLKWPNRASECRVQARGNPILDIGESESNGQTNTGKVLFPYLQKYGGVSMPHTSGSGAGTDFRDSDPR